MARGRLITLGVGRRILNRGQTRAQFVELAVQEPNLFLIIVVEKTLLEYPRHRDFLVRVFRGGILREVFFHELRARDLRLTGLEKAECRADAHERKDRAKAKPDFLINVHEKLERTRGRQSESQDYLTATRPVFSTMA